jgi:hypothetical protein
MAVRLRVWSFACAVCGVNNSDFTAAPSTDHQREEKRRTHTMMLAFALALSASTCHAVTLTWFGEAL